jgi:hypothetical protein
MTPESSRQSGAREACATFWSALLLLATFAGCTWQPVARDVQPELLIPGPAQVDRLLDQDGRFALVRMLGTDGGPSTPHIVHMEQRTHCELPAGSYVPPDPPALLAPNLRGADAREFLLPFFKRDDDKLNLYYADENCALRGPFVETLPENPGSLQLRSDSRNVSLVRAPDGSREEGTLYLVDPWTHQTNKIAEHVSGYAPVQRNDSSNAPEALWLFEGGKLSQRALDGTLLVSPIGSKVDHHFFAQTLRDALRIAYVDDGNLWEAKGPGFSPVLIAEGACAPSYGDNTLDLWLPCADRQLVRVDLTTGMIRRFADKVYESFVTGDLTFERAHENPDDPDDWSMYVTTGTTGTGPRLKLVPRPNANTNVISRDRLVGMSFDGQLGIWTLTGQFTPAYQGLRRIQTFRDQRTGQLLWLFAYNGDAQGVATIGVVDQRQLEAVVALVQQDAGVVGSSDAALAASRPLLIAERAHVEGYRVFYPDSVHEPVILSLEPEIKVIDIDAGTFSGQLHAHVLSAENSAQIDDDVQSFEIVAAPLPGILYGILQGSRSGLWFAAL